MCSSSKRPDPPPILPPPPEPAEFLNEELQRSISSRKILGIRRLQVPLLSSIGSEGGGGGGSVGGGTGGDYAGLSNVRGTAVRTTGKGGSVKVGALTSRGLDHMGNPQSTYRTVGGRRILNQRYGTAKGRNVTVNGVSSFQVESTNITANDRNRIARRLRGD